MKPTIPEVLPLIRAYYRKPGNEVGGVLHVMLDDGNVDQSTADWTVEHARERGDADALEIAELLARMSWTQRNKLSAMNHYAWMQDAAQ